MNFIPCALLCSTLIFSNEFNPHCARVELEDKLVGKPLLCFHKILLWGCQPLSATYYYPIEACQLFTKLYASKEFSYKNNILLALVFSSPLPKKVDPLKQCPKSAFIFIITCSTSTLKKKSVLAVPEPKKNTINNIEL